MRKPYEQRRPMAVFDIETLVGYWSIGFRAVKDGRTRVFEMYEGQPLDRDAISKILRNWCIVGFNSTNYDIPVLMYAMSGATNAELKRFSDNLILTNDPHWVIMERYGLKVPEFIDHIDLSQVTPAAPTMPSLKMLAARLHSKKVQEMPVGIDDEIGEFERGVVRSYHNNDLINTDDLLRDLMTQVELRYLLSNEYGTDVRSKSDAQIAEAVIKTEIERMTRDRLWKPQIREGSFHYQPPAFIRFKTKQMQDVFDTVKRASFYVDHAGTVKMPELLSGLKIKIGQLAYTIGIGGLHSTESSVSHYADEQTLLIDRDVTSYYPSIIIGCGLSPKHIGDKFLTVYERIFQRRLAAKKSGDKSTAETLKIVLNGSFGKFGSPYSVLYSPNLMIQTTITGQLGLLMQIEALEAVGIRVVSANTDGVVARVPVNKLDDYRAIYATWEKQTQLVTEETNYRSLHSRDVNNYIAVKPDGKVKVKGAFAESGPGIPAGYGQKKAPDCDICTEAVIAYLTEGTPIEETIEWGDDIRKFVSVRRVNGGCQQDGQYIGKVVRWYYSKNNTSSLHYVTNGNTVPNSLGAKPCMELPDTFPKDIDHAYYIREAYAILQDIGVGTVDPALRNRTGTFMARLGDQVTYHHVDASTGAALCGKSRTSIRDKWEEVKRLPEKARLCGKCKKQEL